MMDARAAVAPRPGVSLAPLGTLGVGGPAEWFVRATDPAHVEAANAWAAERQRPLFVLGGGSNVIVADRGVPGLVLQVDVRGIRVEERAGETFVEAQAGEVWDDVVAMTVARGLSGIECLSGIPGRVGGTPIQNVGAYGQEASGAVEDVTVLERDSGRRRTLRAGECGFAYRGSRFKEADADAFIVCAVTFRVGPGLPTTTYHDVAEYLAQAGARSPGVADVRGAVLAIRRRKGMVLDDSDADSRSVGSFFVNPVVDGSQREQISSSAGAAAPGYPLAGERVKIPAAWLIEQAGFRRGDADGPVGISSKHTLAIVNRGGATAGDVVRLAARIKRAVADRFGIALVPEPVFVGFGDDPDVAYLRTR